ncbi:MAG: ribonuclease Z [Rhodothermales bacterium]|nr:ribonuclease Z [Rhodothermales bacterium]
MHGRHLSSVLVRVGSTQLLIDCGEATQFQLSASRYKPGKLSTILISHLHGDHWYGLPGLLASLSLAGRTRRLQIVGPDELEGVLRRIPGLKEDELAYPIDFISTNSSDSLNLKKGIRISWAALDHGVPCVGYRIEEPGGEGNLDVDKARSFGVVDFQDYQRLKDGQSVENKLGQEISPSEVISPGKPGRVFAYVSDTRPCENGIMLGRNAQLLMHEATFMEDMRSRAEATGHSTALDAARVAKQARAARLLLTHFSARYEDAEIVALEAQTVFPNTSAAVELAPEAVEELAERI